MIVRIYTVYCDHRGCLAPPIEHRCTEREVGGPGDVRKAAREAGWERLNGKDWCPLHKLSQRNALAEAPRMGVTVAEATEAAKISGKRLRAAAITLDPK